MQMIYASVCLCSGLITQEEIRKQLHGFTCKGNHHIYSYECKLRTVLYWHLKYMSRITKRDVIF